jgi:hypothetical protein
MKRVCNKRRRKIMALCGRPKTFKEKVEEIIKVKHDDMTDDECINAILSAHNAELDRIAEGIEKYIDENSIYQVIFEHYEGIKWIPLQTKRINISEVFLDEQNK